jgi:hypothetical protein
MDAHKMQRHFIAIQQRWRIFQSHCTLDEAWVSFVIVESKEQSKQWMHTHSPDKLKKLFNVCLPES